MRREPRGPCCAGGIDPLPDGRSDAGLYAIEQATAASKAAFRDIAGAPIDGPKVIAFEGEFAMTECHAPELKTQALALQGTVGAGTTGHEDNPSPCSSWLDSTEGQVTMYLFAVLIGIVAGSRTFTAPAAASWAARLGHLDLDRQQAQGMRSHGVAGARHLPRGVRRSTGVRAAAQDAAAGPIRDQPCGSGSSGGLDRQDESDKPLTIAASSVRYRRCCSGPLAV